MESILFGKEGYYNDEEQSDNDFKRGLWELGKERLEEAITGIRGGQ